MAQWVDIPLATQHGEDPASYISDADLVDLMVVPNPPGAPRPFHVAATPALSTSGITMPGSGAVRGMLVRNDNVVFLVRNTTIYASSDLETWTNCGSMPGTDPCRMVEAGDYVVIVDGTEAVACTASVASAVECSRDDFGDVTYQDGYTIFSEESETSQSVYISAVDDPTTINALDFTTVDALAGGVTAVISDHRELFVFKTTSIEHFYNGGGPGFPFVRGSPGLVEKGAPRVARRTVAKLENSVFFVGHDFRVYRLRGYQPEVISTPWVDQYLRDNVVRLDGWTTMYGGAYVLDGRPYYFVTFIDGGEDPNTFTYCVTTGLWHRRVSENVAIFGAGEWHGATSRVLTWDTASLRWLDPDTFADTGYSTPTRRMTMPRLSYGGRRATMHALELSMKTPTTPSGVDLSWSDNGGTSFVTAKDGALHNGAVSWRRLGQFRERILRITISANERIAIDGMRALIDVEAA